MAIGADLSAEGLDSILDGAGGGSCSAPVNASDASIAITLERVMIQAERALLERARRAARERGVTFPQLVRDALEHELGPRSGSPPRLSSAGAISTRGRARERAYEPDPWH
jgi:hypothetical protein